MSVRMMTRVWDMRDLTSGERLVALKFADCANDEGLAYPTLSRVARECELSERAVRYAVRALEARGILCQERPATARAAATYRLFERGNDCPPEGQGLPVRGAKLDSSPAPPIKEHPSRTSEPPKSPATARGGLRRPTRAERKQAEQMLKLPPYLGRCPHDTPCSTHDECILRLVVWQRDETAAALEANPP